MGNASQAGWTSTVSTGKADPAHSAILGFFISSSVTQEVKRDLKIAILAWASIPVALGIFFLVDWVFHHQMKWIEFGVFTTLLFGGLALRLYEDLRQTKCLIVFTGLLFLHCILFACLFHSGIEIRTAWYVPIVFAESFAFGLILTDPAGARSEESDGQDAGSGEK